MCSLMMLAQTKMLILVLNNTNNWIKQFVGHIISIKISLFRLLTTAHKSWVSDILVYIVIAGFCSLTYAENK